MRLRVMHARRRLSASQRSCQAAHHLHEGRQFHCGQELNADLTTAWTHDWHMFWAHLIVPASFNPSSSPDVHTQLCPSLRLSKSGWHSCFSP